MAPHQAYAPTARGFGQPPEILVLANLLLIVASAIMLWPHASGWMIITGGLAVFLFSMIGYQHTIIVFVLLVLAVAILTGHRIFAG